MAIVPQGCLGMTALPAQPGPPAASAPVIHSAPTLHHHGGMGQYPLDAEDVGVASVFTRPRSPYWYIQFRDHQGNWVRQSSQIRRAGAASKREAYFHGLHLEREHARVRNGEVPIEEFIARKKGQTPIDQARDEFLPEIRSKAQRAETAGVLKALIAHSRIELAAQFGTAAVTGKIDRFLRRSLDDGRSIEWVNKQLNAIRRFGDWLWRNGFIFSNETAKVAKMRGTSPRSKLHRAFTPAEAELLTSKQVNLFTMHLGNAEAVPELRRLFYLTRFWTGLRGSEAVKIERRDLDLSDEPTLHVRAEVAKNKLECTVPLARPIAAELAESIAMAHPQARVFAGIPTRRDGRRLLLAADLRAVGLADPQLNARSFRMTFSTWLEAAGVEAGARIKLRRDTGRGALKLVNWTYSDGRQTLQVLRRELAKLEAWHAAELAPKGRAAVS